VGVPSEHHGVAIWPTVLERITAERQRQEELRDAGRFEHTCGDVPGLANTEKLAVLTEEVGEVAREVLTAAELVHDGQPNRRKLAEELTQISAISAAWLEALIKEGLA
jgi:hypothetical protein